MLCRRWGLFTEATVAIDGSKFKAVNHRDRNFTSGKMKTRMALIEQSIAEYLTQLDRMDRKEHRAPAQVARLKERITTLKQEMRRLRGLKTRMGSAPDGQVSLVDPDARSMASQGKGTGIVGYNVQTAVDTKNHLIVVTHEVTNVGSDRQQLKKMAEAAREALGTETLTAIADRGYYNGEQIKACDDAGHRPADTEEFYLHQPCRRALRQERLRLHRQARCVPLPGGRVRHPALHEHRERHGDLQVLGLGLPALRLKSQMHNRRLSPHRPMGT